MMAIKKVPQLNNESNSNDFAALDHNHNLANLTEKSYNSLTDKPVIPSSLSDLTKDINFDERYNTETEINLLLAGKQGIFTFSSGSDLSIDGSLATFFIKSLTSATSFSLSNLVVGVIYEIIIKNTSASKITIPIPNTNDIRIANTFDINANKAVEVSLLTNGTTRFWQVSTELVYA